MNLKQALIRIPGLAADSVISRLSDGPTNSSWLVKRGDQLCVLRLDKPLAAELGLDREAEHDIVETASLARMAPSPLFVDAENGVSLRQYLPGRVWQESDLHNPARLQLLASRLRDLHALPPVGAHYQPGRAARRYAQQLATQEARELADRANLLLADLHEQLSRECLCHNDLVASNILECSDGLKLIDWEYAGLGDRWFDLALVIEHHDLNDELQSAFIGAYLQREPRESEFSRLLAWRKFYSILLSLWRLRTA